MPFMSYQISREETVRNAGRFMKEAGCDAVKLEGGDEALDAVMSIASAGIPVLGHIGLTPQTISKLGGFRIQGKTAESVKALVDQAAKLERAGCFGLVLECVPEQVGKIVSEKVSIPVIGIGAGKYCDGQVLVLNDMVGLFDRFVPKFVKQYVKLSHLILEGLKKYREEVEKGIFPSEEHAFAMKDEELKKLKKA
jgi:3-methyl-2-oxobutanoate hydroxymethyltransferase